MAVRLVVTFKALPGKGADYAKAFASVIKDVVQKDKGCMQYELFRSMDDPDTLVLLERWADQATLDAHAAANRARGPSPTAQFRSGNAVLEQYETP
ncbi:MAG: antibiotic biosynthesis monooxygenase [Dehalococcoidia bacterium]|nr:antibiotic biosynthesis monooxygenase [Dehalococcoidia bacterium]